VAFTVGSCSARLKADLMILKLSDIPTFNVCCVGTSNMLHDSIKDMIVIQPGDQFVVSVRQCSWTPISYEQQVFTGLRD
jgi:hypothetical protein